MILARLIANEAHVPIEQVMLLRRANENINKLLASGGSVEDYTFMQPTGSKYDYTHPDKVPVKLVAVISHDKIYAVYRVLGVKREGTTYSLTSEAHKRFDIERGKAERPAKLYNMESVNSACLRLPVTGWEGARSRTAVQRFDGGFFEAIEVEVPIVLLEEEVLLNELDNGIKESLAGNAAQRKSRLANAPKFARRIEVRSFAFIRNPDVVAEVLFRANGKCEICKSSAPFLHRTDRTPYLEVHHKIRLADFGEDTVANAVAACPNCHRREHYA